VGVHDSVTRSNWARPPNRRPNSGNLPEPTTESRAGEAAGPWFAPATPDTAARARAKDTARANVVIRLTPHHPSARVRAALTLTLSQRARGRPSPAPAARGRGNPAAEPAGTGARTPSATGRSVAPGVAGRGRVPVAVRLRAGRPRANPDFSRVARLCTSRRMCGGNAGRGR
jgi:hypothetical protein